MGVGQIRLKTCGMGGVVFHMPLPYSAYIARQSVVCVCVHIVLWS